MYDDQADPLVHIDMEMVTTDHRHRTRDPTTSHGGKRQMSDGFYLHIPPPRYSPGRITVRVVDRTCIQKRSKICVK